MKTDPWDRADPVRTGIVRILDKDDKVVGTGFLVDRNSVATCAHVIKDAGSLPGESVKIQFLRDRSGKNFSANVSSEYWRETDNGDVAFLGLAESLPEGVAPVQLGELVLAVDRGLKGYGFPVGEFNGLGADATVVEVLSHEQRYQLRSKELTYGYSGGPLWDAESGVVVGMVQSVMAPDNLGRLRDTAFAISSEMLREVYPLLNWQSASLPPLLLGLNLGGGGLEESLRRWFVDTQRSDTLYVERPREVDELNRWLEGANRPKILVLWGPPGRGKSSLLSRWAEQLRKCQKWKVALLPISIRHKLAKAEDLLSALLGRLSFLLGVPYSPDYLDVRRCRDALATTLSKLSRLPLVLVIDGIDETDADLLSFLPSQLGDDVRVVIAVRCTSQEDIESWMRKLDLDDDAVATSMCLEPLETNECSKALHGRQPELSDTDICDLISLSRGEPLSLSSYVLDVKSGAKIKELQVIGPSLQRHFSKWFDQLDQAHPETRLLLALFASAREPLSSSDLANLSNELGTSDAIRDQLRRLFRYVSRDNGLYSFSHLLFREFVVSRLSDQERDEAQRCYRTWVTRSLEKIDHQVPAQYLVRNAGAHLQESEDFKGLANLVGSSWRKAWRTIDITEAGFLNDTRLAANSAAYLNRQRVQLGGQLHWIAQEVQYPLYFAAIEHVRHNQPAWLIGKCVEEGVISVAAAIAIVTATFDGSFIPHQLADLASSVPDHSRNELVAWGRRLPSGAQRAEVLAAVACLGGPNAEALTKEACGLVFDTEAGEECARAIARLVPRVSKRRLANMLTRLADRFGPAALALALTSEKQTPTRLSKNDWERLRQRAVRPCLEHGETWTREMLDLERYGQDQSNGTFELGWWDAAERSSELRTEERSRWLEEARKEIEAADAREHSAIWSTAAKLLTSNDDWMDAMRALAGAHVEDLIGVGAGIESAPVSFWDLLDEKLVEFDGSSSWLINTHRLLMCVPKAPPAHQRSILRKAIELIEKVEVHHINGLGVQLIYALKAAYPNHWIQRAKEVTEELRDRRFAAYLFYGAACELPQDARDYLQKALETTAQIGFPAKTARLLACLATHVEPDRVSIGLSAASMADREPNRYERICALVGTLRAFKEGDQASPIEKTLEGLPLLGRPGGRGCYAWKELAQHAPEAAAERIRQHAKRYDYFDYGLVLGWLAEKIPEEVMNHEVRAIVSKILEDTSPDVSIARGIANIARWVTQDEIDIAVNDTRAKEKNVKRAHVIAKLAPFVSDEEKRNQLVADEVMLVQDLGEKSGVLEVLVHLSLVPGISNARRIRKVVLDRALQLFHDRSAECVSPFATMLSNFPKEERIDVAEWSLELTGIDYPSQTLLIGALAGTVTPNLRGRAYDALSRTLLRYPGSKASFLDGLTEMAPLICELGGEETAYSLAKIVEDAYPWG